MVDIIAETERLRLRTHVLGDAERLDHYCNTLTAMVHLGGVEDFEEISARFERIDECRAENGHSFWIVERKSDAEFMGLCGLKRINAPGTDMTGAFEIGWQLREDYWGHGYAQEAATKTLELAFDRYDAPHVTALTDEKNVASWRLMQRLGMERRTDLDFDDPDDDDDDNPTIVYRMGRRQWKG